MTFRALKFLSISLLLVLLICDAICHGKEESQEEVESEDEDYREEMEGSESVQSSTKVKPSPYTVMLPTNLKPTNYKIKVRPILEDSNDFQEWTFPGDVTITFTVMTDTDTIVLHAYNLSLFQEEVKVLNVKKGMGLKLKSLVQSDETETFTVTPETKLMAGEEFQIFIPFVGIMMGKSVGLYGFSYPDAMTGGNKMAAATQCQPFHAREIFPCFDEFHWKATFDISIGRLEKYQTFSNSKIKESIADAENKGWMWDVYETTPLMGTNMVDIVVVDGYTSVMADPSIMPNMKIQVWAPQSMTDQKSTEYAVGQTARVMKYFTEYFDFPYPLSKLDSILIWQTDGPAIQHWGAITYGVGGTSIVKFEGMTPEWKRLSISSLIAHEIAHQWMGNVISVGSLSDIWVHEGFADFFAEEAVAQVQPEFRSNVLFINTHFQRALRGDQAKGTHPLKHKFALTKAQMDDDEDPVDDLTYIKGASLVRMMRNFLTEPVFKQGLRAFLKQFAYKPINQDDLFEALNSIKPNGLPAGVTVKQIMDTWTLQAGYPLCRVNTDGPKAIQIFQERINAGKMTGGSQSRWWVPIKISSEAKPIVSNTPPDLWLSDTTHMMNYSTNIDTTKWIIVNPDATGYFRTLYDKNLRNLIKQQLDKDHTVFSPVTRSQILDDALALALHTDYISLEDALELTTYLDKETEMVVWSAIFNHLRTAINMFNGHFDGLQKYLVPKIDAVLSSPGIHIEQGQNDQGMAVIFRMELLRYGCMLQSPVCHKYSKTLMDAWRAAEEMNPVPLDLQPALYCSAVASGDKEMFNFVKKMHDQLPPSEQRAHLFKALGCSTDAGTLKMMVDEAWKGDRPLQTLETLADNPMGKLLVVESIKKNIAQMNPEQFSRIVDILTDYWIEPEQISDLEKFLKANEKFFEPIMEDLKDEFGIAKNNVAWMNSVGKRMNDWFNSHSK